jgi:SNF2 family DNA or RNA helicase
MGLGKTIQVITLLLRLKKEDYFKKFPVLIVVPTTLITNWFKEIQKFAPDLNLSIYHGLKRELNLKNMDIVITSYGVLKREFEKLQKQVGRELSLMKHRILKI